MRRPRAPQPQLSVAPRAATLCFHDVTALDLVDGQGRKVVGSAQRRSGGRVLHHGSIPLGGARLSDAAGSLSAAAGREVGWDEAAEAVVAAFGAVLGARWEAGGLSPAEEAAAARLAAVHADPQFVLHRRQRPREAARPGPRPARR